MKNLSILIVDDDPVIRHLLTQRLIRENYIVTAAADGQVAVDLMNSNIFDVVLTDLMMPGDIGGIEVLDAAKAINSNIEVVLITAHSSVGTAVEAMKKGAADYLEKPINFDELLLRLDKIANMQTILRSAQDLQMAMNATEQEASLTIQNLEMKVAEQQGLLDQLEATLANDDIEEDQRITLALELLSGQ